MEHFCKLSGQKINSFKSKSIFLKYCNQNVKILVKDSFGISPSTHFGNYLGFPILNGKLKTSDFQYILNNMKKKLSNWKTNFLTMVGWPVLAKSTLNAIKAYAMQYFNLPKKTCNSIDKIQRDFIWGSTNQKRKTHIVSWEKTTTPK